MRLAVIALLSLCWSVAGADVFKQRLEDGSYAFSDTGTASSHRLAMAATHRLSSDDLPGLWKAVSFDGAETTLTLRTDGSFVIDQRDASSPQRLYMCGDWSSREDALDFHVKGYKKRLADGATEQADGQFRSSAAILSARRDRLIVEFEGRRLVLDRS